MTFADQVRELHAAFGLDIGVPLTYARFKRYADRLLEEMGEAREAIVDLRGYLALEGEKSLNTRAEVLHLLKELQDVHYMASVLSVVFGWDEAEAFRRVHQSNMSKLWEDGKPRFREDGKIMKPPTYQPPLLGDLV